MPNTCVVSDSNHKKHLTTYVSSGKTKWEHTNTDLCCNKPETFMDVPASMTPLFGRTQYLRGAVVLTLKHTFLSVGFVSFRLAVTTSVNGPVGHNKKRQKHHAGFV